MARSVAGPVAFKGGRKAGLGGPGAPGEVEDQPVPQDDPGIDGIGKTVVGNPGYTLGTLLLEQNPKHVTK